MFRSARFYEAQLRSVVAVSAGLLMATAPAQAGTPISYQGVLNQNGAPYNGTTSIRFRIYDAPIGGAFLGASNHDNVTIVDGLIMEQLEYNDAIFEGADGTNRWLDIEVLSSGSFQLLSPRQPISATPFALRSANAAIAQAVQGISIDANDKVGIGTSTPATRLHVKGSENNGTTAGLTIESTGTHDEMLLDGNEIDCTTGPIYLNNNIDNDVILAKGGGNVGIGTSTPTARLQVAGAESDGSSGALHITSSSQSMILDGNEIDTNASTLHLNGNSSRNVTLAGGGGNVGVAVASPSARLHVLGADNDGTTASLKIETAGGDTMLLDGNEIDCTSGPIYLNNNNANNVILGNGGGNVGIGTTSPSGLLHLSHTGDAFLVIDADTNNNNSSGNAQISLVQGSGDQIGLIGFKNGDVLQIMNELDNTLVLGADGEDVVTVKRNQLETVGNVYAVSPNATTAGRVHTYGPGGTINFRATYVLGKPDWGYIAVRDDANVDRARMYVEEDSNGNPCGAVRTDFLYIEFGADIAEPFNIRNESTNDLFDDGSDSEILPGMVVSIDPANAGELRLSTNSYDRTVAGIISGAGGVKPGMMLQQEGTKASGKHPVALTGRVYCYVDADAGAVEPGDLLTTSDTPGHAMKVSDNAQAQGAIIGKAMTGLESGRGLVLVLVSLQ